LCSLLSQTFKSLHYYKNALIRNYIKYSSYIWSPFPAALTIITAMTAEFAPFSVTLSGHSAISSKYISLEFRNNSNANLRIQVVQVLICIEGVDHNDVFKNALSYNIIAGSNRAERDFLIDLDPWETRSYTVVINTGLEAEPTFRFQITTRDNNGQDVYIHGVQQGRDPDYVVAAEMSPMCPQGETAYALIRLGRIVRTKSIPGVFRITNESGLPNDFGIFDKHKLNPTAAYIDAGCDGYRHLIGKHTEYFDWDRDTVAYPPDDLNAVHISSMGPAAVLGHGWVFRTDLIFTDSNGQEWPEDGEVPARSSGEHDQSTSATC
jgi:hypothetical protein